MSYSVNSCFDRFQKEYVDLDSGQTKDARASRDFVLKNIIRLSESRTLPKLNIANCLNYGSFVRNTKIRPLDDIDMMICYHGSGGFYDTVLINELYHVRINDGHSIFDSLRNDDGQTLNSRKVINHLIKALSGVEQYSKAEFHRDHEAARLQLSSYPWNFDLVPCFITEENFYLIPDGNGNWKNTDPRIDEKRVLELNKITNGAALPLIRLIKYWARLKWDDSISSYMLEQMVLNCLEVEPLLVMRPVQYRVQKVLAYLSRAIKNPVIDPKGIQGDLNELDSDKRDSFSEVAEFSSYSAYKAIEFERFGNVHEAIRQWSLIFGYEFLDE